MLEPFCKGVNESLNLAQEYAPTSVHSAVPVNRCIARLLVGDDANFSIAGLGHGRLLGCANTQPPSNCTADSPPPYGGGESAVQLEGVCVLAQPNRRPCPKPAILKLASSPTKSRAIQRFTGTAE